MDDFLKALDWRLRLAMWLGCIMLATTLCLVAAKTAVTGPWWVGIAALVVAAFVASQESKIWPKLPDRLQERIVDKWRSQRNKATKSTGGKLVWKLGRSACWTFASVNLLATFSSLQGAAFWIPAFGFGIATGFCGAEAALATGAFVALCARIMVGVGLGTDLTDPAQRNIFMGQWATQSQKLSWMWAFAIGASGPAWVGLSVAYSSIKTKVIEQMRQRKALAEDKKRIDARRERMKTRSVAGKDDRVAKAQLELEKAQERVKQVARGAQGGTSSADHKSDENAPVELSAVQKLENMNMEGRLAEFARIVAQLQSTERSHRDAGIQTMPQSSHRRSFDRMLMSIDYQWVTHMRASNKPEIRALASYYDELTTKEVSALRGGDGEIVSSSPVANHAPEISVADDETHDLVDIMDREEKETSEEAPSKEGRRGTFGTNDEEPDNPEGDLPMMLAKTIGETRSGEPTADGVLPVEDDQKTKEQNEMTPGDFTDSAETVAPASVDSLFNGASAPHAKAAGEGDLGQSSTMSEDGPDEPEDDRPDTAEKELVTETVGEGDQKVSTTELAPVAPDANEVVGADAPASPLEVADADRRKAARSIMRNPSDRAVVTLAHDWFGSLADLAGVIGFPEEELDDDWQAFSKCVTFYRAELDLAAMIAGSDASLDVVLKAADDAVAAEWDHDAELVARARSWVESRREELRKAAEAEEARRTEELRLAEEARLAEAARVAEAERLAHETKAAEDARLAELARLAEEEKAAEEERVAEQTRLAELESKRGLFSAWIMSGYSNDELLAHGLELFPTAEELVAQVHMPMERVQPAFDAFARQAGARVLWNEIMAAYLGKNLDIVEILLARREELEGYDAGAESTTIETIENWASGERNRQRIAGFVDGEVKVQTPGVDSQKAFIKKQHRVSNEHVDLIENVLPKCIGELNGIKLAYDGGFLEKVPNAADIVEDAKLKVAKVAAAIVYPDNGAKPPREYAVTFLPDSVRSPGKNIWDTLVELADFHREMSVEQGSTEDQDNVSDPDGETEEQLEPDSHLEADDANADATAVVSTGRLSVKNGGVGFDAKPIKTLDEINALDANNEVDAIATLSNFSLGGYLKGVRIAADGAISNSHKELITITGDHVSVPVIDASGTRLGYVLFFVAHNPAPVWIQESHVLQKDVTSGARSETALKKWIQNYSNYLDQSSDPDATLGVVILSPIVTEEGLTLFRHVMKNYVNMFMFQNVGESEVRQVLTKFGSA